MLLSSAGNCRRKLCGPEGVKHGWLIVATGRPAMVYWGIDYMEAVIMEKFWS